MERFSIRKTDMQGTVWAGLECNYTMDQLCKLILEDKNLLYKYRGVISVPPLEMVDDTITAVKCISTAVTLMQPERPL